jgi:hypothetical protein
MLVSKVLALRLLYYASFRAFVSSDFLTYNLPLFRCFGFFRFFGRTSPNNSNSLKQIDIEFWSTANLETAQDYHIR